MEWKSLFSNANLVLAWRRVNTGRNLQHKRFFREVYLVYETSLEENLKDLGKRLRTEVWEASSPQRIYLPKPSGLQRPITLLGIEDQIVYQAIANVVAKKTREKRKAVEMNTVFSEILTQNPSSIFFTVPWQQSYPRFQEKEVELFENGNEWVADFDLAAYFDTISHDLLILSISPRGGKPKTWRKVKGWLKVWSSQSSESNTSHGIPQGPTASAYLAEAFFLPIDLMLQKKEIKYIRYVDDIKIFGKDENEIRTSVVILEKLCREKGLIPQGSKYGIKKATSTQGAMGKIPSILGEGSRDDTYLMESEEAEGIMTECLEGRPFRIIDKTKFNYLLFRAPKSPKILKKVLKLFPNNPEHIDAYVAYFGNYTKSKPIVDAIIKMLKSSMPYTYVRGELWHVLARLGKSENLRDVIKLAKCSALNRANCIGLSWGVMHFLLKVHELGLSKIGNRLCSESPLSMSLLAPIIPSSEEIQKVSLTRMLKGSVEEQLAATRELQVRKISLKELDLIQKNIGCQSIRALKGLGVIKRSKKKGEDWVAKRLSERYGVIFPPIWHLLLESEYAHALQLLIEANALYLMSPGNWLQYQDAFNDVIIRKFISFLINRKLLNGKQKLKSAGGDLVKYGQLINESGALSKKFPFMCERLRAVHNRRNRLPGSHPYDEKGGAVNSFLKTFERNKLASKEKKVLLKISTYFADNQ